MAMRLFLTGAARRIPRAGFRAAEPVLLPKATSVGAPLHSWLTAQIGGISSAAKMAPQVAPVVSLGVGPSIITKAAALVLRGVSWTTKPYASRGLSTTSTTKAPGKPGGGRPSRYILVVCAISGGIVFWYSMSDIIDDEELPESIDWSIAPFFPNAVHPCYNARCGSCWAVVAVKSIEAVRAINTGLVQNLSIQQVIDCAAIEGCRGAHLVDAYSYITKAGLTTEKAYPGPPSRGRSFLYGKMIGYCKMKGKPVAQRIEGQRRVLPNEMHLMIALQSSPVAVYVNVNERFRRYDGGILKLDDCPPRSEKPAASHCLLVVGYGTAEDGTKYWKLMNTWGSWYGKGGFVFFERGGHPHGVAGITEYCGFRPVLTGSLG